MVHHILTMITFVMENMLQCFSSIKPPITIRQLVQLLNMAPYPQHASSEFYKSSARNCILNKTAMYKVTLRRVRATILKSKSIYHYIFRVSVCSLSYTECNAHGPYCHLWSVRLYFLYPHYLINGMIFGGEKKLLNMNCVFFFILSTTFV
jgi:hypothetical protein